VTVPDLTQRATSDGSQLLSEAAWACCAEDRCVHVRRTVVRKRDGQQRDRRFLLLVCTRPPQDLQCEQQIPGPTHVTPRHTVSEPHSQCAVPLFNIDTHPLRRFNQQCPSRCFRNLKFWITKEIQWSHSRSTVQPLTSHKTVFFLILYNWFYCSPSIKTIPEHIFSPHLSIKHYLRLL